jgi:hypothetical protein
MRTEHELERQQRMANRNALQAHYIVLTHNAGELYRAYESNPTQ